jgi:exodeoxyribonuclease V alpha subunit
LRNIWVPPVSSGESARSADISGIGFITADKIAQNLGIPRDSLARVEAGLLYVLHQLSDEGHVYYPYESLIEEGMRILGVDRQLILEAFGQLAKERKIVWEDLGEPSLKDGAMEAPPKAVYLAGYFAAEMGIAWKIREILKHPSGLRPIRIEQAIEWAQARLNLVLAEKQKEAIGMALQNKAMVLTGGPGTGKTTIIRAILEVFAASDPPDSSCRSHGPGSQKDVRSDGLGGQNHPPAARVEF